MASAVELSDQTDVEVSDKTDVKVSDQTDVEVSDQTDVEPEGKPQMIYRCKKCRRIVASEDQIVPHDRGEGQKCFRRKRTDGIVDGPSECSSIFVEPLKWMQAVEEGNLAQKLQCIGCNARLGSFSWVGMLCNCGARVIPAFQLHKSRIDECRI